MSNVRVSNFMNSSRHNIVPIVAFFVLLAGCGAIALVPGQACGAGIRTVALSGQRAPGTPDGVMFFTHLFPPLLDGDGQVAFFTTVTGPGVDITNQWGIWSEFDGALTLVARAGDQAATMPAGVTYGIVGQNVSYTAGRIAFHSSLTGPNIDSTNDGLILSGTPGSLRRVAREGDQAPNLPTGVAFAQFSSQSINSVGQTAFNALLTGPGVTGSNVGSMWSEGSGTLRMAAREGMHPPGTPDGSVFNLLPTATPIINNAGGTAFSAEAIADSAPHVTTGIWSEKSGTLGLVARTHDPAPGTAPGVVFGDGVFSGIHSPGGQTSIRAGLQGPGVEPSNDSGIWSDRGGSLALVVREGDQIPGMPAGTGWQFPSAFSILGRPAVNAHGALALGSWISGPSVEPGFGIWSEGSASLDLVVRSGEHAPGTPTGVSFGFQFESIALNSLGQTAFLANLTGSGVDGTNRQGIWAEDALGQLQLIVREGDVLEVATDDFRTISSLENGAFNDRGQVAFRASFTDFTDGLFVSDLVAVPEPSTLALFAGGLIGLLIAIRRRRPSA